MGHKRRQREQAMKALSLSQTRAAGRFFPASPERAQYRRTCRAAGQRRRASASRANAPRASTISLPLCPFASLPRAFLIDTSCHSKAIVSSTKQRIGVPSNRHKISRTGFLIFNREVGAGRLRPRLANMLRSHYNESIHEVRPRNGNFFQPSAPRWAFVFMGELVHG